MTDTKKIQNLKDYIKNVIGEKDYLTFMSRIAGSTEPITTIATEYGLFAATVNKWVVTLGYRSGRTRQALRSYYTRLNRIKEREKKTAELFNLLKKHSEKKTPK